MLMDESISVQDGPSDPDLTDAYLTKGISTPQVKEFGNLCGSWMGHVAIVHCGIAEVIAYHFMKRSYKICLVSICSV